MPSQVLAIRPEHELVFKGPFNKVVVTSMKLKNPSSDTVAFKVKTTAPKRYCVRPNSGLVPANGEVDVAVMLQPFDYDPNEKARHKFMVQSLVVKEAAIDSLEELWKSADSTSLMDSKLKVVLDPGDEKAAAASADDKQQQPSPAQEQQQHQQQQQQQQKLDSQLPEAGRQQQQQSKEPQYQQSASGDERMQRLQQENLKLREENSRLSEQEVRLRKLAMRDTKAGDAAGPQAPARPQAQLAGPAVPPVLFLVLALVLGLVVGKFVL